MQLLQIVCEIQPMQDGRLMLHALYNAALERIHPDINFTIFQLQKGKSTVTSIRFIIIIIIKFWPADIPHRRHRYLGSTSVICISLSSSAWRPLMDYCRTASSGYRLAQSHDRWFPKKTSRGNSSCEKSIKAKPDLLTFLLVSLYAYSGKWNVAAFDGDLLVLSL